MSTVQEASLVLANLTNSPRHLPAFQMRVQYSKNQDIVIKFNNSKSFDFTAPDAVAQFAQLREASAGESPFFEPEPQEEIPAIFDAWRPVHFDPNFTHVISVTNFEDSVLTECDHFRNLFAQYGPVAKVRIVNRGRKIAFVTMSNGFYARVALTFLQNLRIDGRALTFEFSFYSELQNGSELTKEYQNDDDVDLEEYGAMWFPSEYVLLKPFDVPVEQLGVGPVARHPRASAVQFRTVDDATRCIALHNNAKIDGRALFMRFTSLSD
jgi:hypothetical protein